MDKGVKNIIRNEIYSRNEDGSLKFRVHNFGLRKFTRHVKKSLKSLKKGKPYDAGDKFIDSYLDSLTFEPTLEDFFGDSSYNNFPVIASEYFKNDYEMCMEAAQKHIEKSDKYFRKVLGLDARSLRNAQLLLKRAKKSAENLYVVKGADSNYVNESIDQVNDQLRVVSKMMEFPESYHTLEILEFEKKRSIDSGLLDTAKRYDDSIDALLDSMNFNETYIDSGVKFVPNYKIRNDSKFTY